MKKVITLRQLEIFNVVARELSFSKAAHILSITQPAISVQIRELENIAGTKLLERAGHRISLTDAGRLMLEGALKIGSLIDETLDSIRTMEDTAEGPLKLGSVHDEGSFSPFLLAQFAKQHPGITVRFSVGPVETITAQLESNEIDLAIIGKGLRETNLIEEPFALTPFIAVAHPSHPLAGKRRISLEMLAQERLLCRDKRSSNVKVVASLFHKRQLPFKPVLETRTSDLVKQAALAGLGIAFVSMYRVADEIKAGKLVALNVTGFSVMNTYKIAHTRDKPLSSVAEAFRSFILAEGAKTIKRAFGVPVSAPPKP